MKFEVISDHRLRADSEGSVVVYTPVVVTGCSLRFKKGQERPRITRWLFHQPPIGARQPSRKEIARPVFSFCEYLFKMDLNAVEKGLFLLQYVIF
jgi:hypothetical protein